MPRQPPHELVHPIQTLPHHLTHRRRPPSHPMLCIIFIMCLFTVSVVGHAVSLETLTPLLILMDV